MTKIAWEGRRALRRTESAADNYRSVRRNPSLVDVEYLHLVDLRDALVGELSAAQGLWLDYGAHTSPYASFMPGAQLESADIVGGTAEPEPTYRFEAGMACPASDDRFEGILSTQVLEHVESPADYLRDAARMTKRGGLLLLTTHGIWEDHPSPSDYRRWTSQGLRVDVEAAGFEVRNLLLLTCGMRAVATLSLVQLANRLDRGQRRTAWPIEIGVRLLALAINGLVGALTRSQRQLREGDAKLYLVLLVVAERR